MAKINDLEVFQKSLKELNEYSAMLISGKYPTHYIVEKVQLWAEAVKHDAPFVDKQVKEQK